MTTLFELCSAAPAPGRGHPTQIDYGAGVWRHVVEIADPAAGAGVVWHDITAFLCGYEYTRGADQYQGRYRASVANIEVCTDDDQLAPWNSDTSPMFGVHVELGPGLLIRSGFIRVDAGVVAEWNPRFTLKVESWGDAAYSQGRIRRHLIVARDTLTSLVSIPLPARAENNWSEHMYLFLVDSGWPYGSLIYGAQYAADTTTPILLLPARPAASSAVNELDVILDPVGLVWYTNRTGTLVVRPRVDDTFHAAAFAAGATGDQYPGTVTPVDFTWWACQEIAGESPSTAASYAQDNSTDPFGLDRTERAVINHVKIAYPAGGFDDDDPISIQRYDRHTMQASWIAANDTVAAQILASRADATVEARPLHTTLGMPGFHPGPATLDYLERVAIQHRNNDNGLVAYADGWLRHQREQVAPRGCDVDWSLTNIVDVYQVTSDAGLFPVEDLAVFAVDETSAQFSWTNPTQMITPTHTQFRLLNTASLWATAGYPITGVGWGSLAGATGYTFQVRLIRVVDGVITHYSPLRQVTFVTDTPTNPPPVIDDGTVTFPTPPCGTLDWELQESTDPTTWDNPLIPEYAVIDSGTISSTPFTLDLSGYTFNPAKLYRVCQDACGVVNCSNLFAGACSEPAILGTAPYNDADLVAYWPAICPPDIVVESISETAAAHGPTWDGFVLDADSSVVLIGNGDGLVAYGPAPAALADLDDDTTLAARVLLMTQPDSPVLLFGVAGLGIWALADGGNWKVRGTAAEEGAGITTITSGSLELDFGTWYDLAIVHDATGEDLFLYVDGAEVASALGTVGTRHVPGTVDIGVSDNGLITNCAVWDRVLDPSELPGYVTPTPPGIANVVAHWDASHGTTTVTFVEDLIGSSDLAGIDMTLATQHGLTALRAGSSGGARLRSVTSPVAGGAQPFGVTIVARNTGTHVYFNHGPSPAARPHATTAGGVNTMDAGTVLTDGVADLYWHVYYFEFDGSTSRIYIDGLLETTGNAGTGAPVGNVITFLNNQLGGVDPTPGTWWAEAKLSTGVQAAVDVLAEANALIAKWGLRGSNAICTGGTITIDTPTLVEHTFLTSGKLRLASGTLPVDYLVAGGGGAGARGGGGAGGVKTGSTSITSSPTITVGVGGIGASMPGATNPAVGTSGTGSAFGAITTLGGGGGGGGGPTGDGVNGGSGGGGGATSGINKLAGTGTAGQGNAGGRAGAFTAANFPSGGGGGAGAVGGNATGSSQSGVGGAGIEWPTGSGNFYGGGGGGGLVANVASTAAGGSGVGGTGGNGTINGGNATANTGSGGGGTGNPTTTRTAGSGANGIVKVRYNPTAWTP